MSDALYTLRVFYEPGRLGCVKVPGVYRNLTHAPQIPGLPELLAIDYGGPAYAPELTPTNGARREMTQAEVSALREWLLAVQEGRDGS